MHVKQAVFLVGGKGSRLGAIAQRTPKPLLKLSDGQRFLDVLIRQAVRYGFSKILLLAGHLGEVFEELYQGRSISGAKVTVVRETEAMGTGGALLNAKDYLDPWFILSNGDTFFDVNLRAFSKNVSCELLGKVALRGVPDASRYGTVKLENGLVTSFEEKERGGAALISAGTYLLSRSIIDKIEGSTSLESEIFPGLAKERKLRGEKLAGYFIDIGLPSSYEKAFLDVPLKLRKPAVFLDRDGVINVDTGHTHRQEDLVWIKDAKAAIRLLNDLGYYVIVVTNQAGVARGFYSEQQVRNFHQHLQLKLWEEGGHIDEFYYCPYHKDSLIDAYRHANHRDRKPNPGMIEKAIKEWPIDVTKSFLIGDNLTDLAAAKRANIDGYMFRGGSLIEFVHRTLVIRKSISQEHAEIAEVKKKQLSRP